MFARRAVPSRGAAGGYHCFVQVRADVSARILAINFTPEDRAKLLAIVASTDAPPVSKRRVMQTFDAVASYFTEADWNVLLCRDTHAATKLERLLMRIAALGGRCLTEGSFKVITAIFFIVSEGYTGALNKTATAKHDMMNHIKGEFKKRIRSMDQPQMYLTTLPREPAEFLSKCPDAAKTAYGDEVPAASRIELAQIVAIGATFHTRGGLRSSTQTLALTPQPTQPSEQQMMPQMMQQMQQMMFAMMQMAQGGAPQQPTIQPTSSRTPRALNNLELVEPRAAANQFAQRRAITLDHVEQQPRSLPAALPAPPPEPETTPAPTTTQPAVVASGDGGSNALAQMTPEKPAAKHQLDQGSAQKATPNKGSADDVLNGMLAVLSERDVDNKKKRRLSQKTPDKSASASVTMRKVSPGSSKPKQTSKTSAASSAKSSSCELERWTKPHYNVEQTRSQVLCRTGFRGAGQSLAIK